jgi:hypothetical protein
MTEPEWLTCENPDTMLDFLDGRPADWRLRLFACACCRRIWDLITSPLHRRAVETAERFAVGAGRAIAWGATGGLATRPLVRPEGGLRDPEWAAALWELEAYRDGLDEPAYSFRYDHGSPEDTAGWTLYARWDMPWVVARNAAWFRAAPYRYWERLEEPRVSPEQEREWEAGRRVEGSEQSKLLRDLGGNPFRPVALDPLWLTPTVTALARQMYESRDFSPMPILADALQDAECDNPDVLDHCRGNGPHVRGCWVVDLVLGRA